MVSNTSWEAIFKAYNIYGHDFSNSPFYISNTQIKKVTKNYKTVAEKEVRILCKQDSDHDRPDIFKKHGLFILPTKNGEYALIQGRGYIDVPEIASEPISYTPNLDFELETSVVGNSEMQHLDYAYAASMIRSFVEDKTLLLTIRGRKYTPKFSFVVGKHTLSTQSVQTEIDAGYEGANKVVLVEAKNSKTSNVIIRQLFYPYKQWQTHTKKEVLTVFFEKRGKEYLFWLFAFKDPNDYNSIHLIKSQKYVIL